MKNGEEGSETLSLYAIISDKNRIIQALKQRLMNQQLQLAFYLHKNLFNENILEFSSQCSPNKIKDQNIQLSLAMCNFMKDGQGTKKLCKLHEKLNDYDQKVSEILLKQEEIVKNACKNENFDTISQMSTHSEVYKKIMNTTAEVKKELAELRSCSQKIDCLESEKKALADIIFTEQKKDVLLKCQEQIQPTPSKELINPIKKIPSNTHLKVLPITPRSTKGNRSIKI